MKRLKRFALRFALIAFFIFLFLVIVLILEFSGFDLDGQPMEEPYKGFKQERKI